MDALAWTWVLLSLLCAGTIAFAGFGLQAAVTATTATVVNQMNKVAGFVLAHVIFREEYSALMIVATIITMLGTVWYSVEGVLARQRKAAAAAAPAPSKPDEETPLNKGESPEAPSRCVIS